MTDRYGFLSADFAGFTQIKTELNWPQKHEEYRIQDSGDKKKNSHRGLREHRESCEKSGKIAGMVRPKWGIMPRR